MNTKTDKVVDAIFLIALAFVVAGLIISVAISGKRAEASYEPTTLVTVTETTEFITEPIQTETPTAEATEPSIKETTEPSIKLFDVPLDEDLQIHIIETAEANGIDPAIIFAMAYRESTYRAHLIGDNGNSYGLLQVQPYWHSGRMERLGCTDLLDPYQNVTVAVDYLCELLNRYNGDMAKALTAYNRGHYAGTITYYAKAVMATAAELAVN